ncbi:MAG: hypothetical protein LUC33_06750, partial [Prevotellaceae bacterium]|nr:hypothetical protein [Prevotellaceae bacterium]
MDKATVDYSGLTTLPDDTQCKDGALAFATNAVYEDGALKTYPPALAKGLVVKKDDKVYLHSTASYTHYIIARQDGGSVLLFWVDKDTCEAETVHWTGGGIATNGETGVKSWENDEKDTDNAVTWIGSCDGTLADMVMVGNTVVMSTSASLHYLIWKSEDGDYAYLGTEVPRIDMQWGLELECGYGAVFSKFDFE